MKHEIEDAVRDAAVPNLILQPLVENALKHGIEPQTRPGLITLRAAILPGRRVRLEVEDNGRGLGPGKSAEGGIGTANSRSRLVQLYGDAARIEFLPGADGGLRVRVEFPLER